MPTYVLMLVREGSFVFCLSAYSSLVLEPLAWLFWQWVSYAVRLNERSWPMVNLVHLPGGGLLIWSVTSAAAPEFIDLMAEINATSPGSLTVSKRLAVHCRCLSG